MNAMLEQRMVRAVKRRYFFIPAPGDMSLRNV
jgi:hypothetical protein